MHYFAVLLLSLSAVGHAHPLDMGLVEITQTAAGFATRLELNEAAAAALIRKPDRTFSILEAQGASAALLQATWGAQTTLANCGWKGISSDKQEQNIHLTATVQCPPGTVVSQWHFDWVQSPTLASTFQLVVHLKDSGSDSIRTVDRNHVTVEWNSSPSQGVWSFILSGMHHIGATPDAWITEGKLHWPDGIDHILFVVALVLASPFGWPLFKALTGFTLGHSITLALVSLGLIHVSSAVVEPVIALSIALLSLLTLLKKQVGHWWPLTAFFGLVHGMGFGAALLERHLTGKALAGALIGFNVGVELGQLVVVLAVFPVLVFLSRTLEARRLTINLGSASITVAGFYWFVVRLMAVL